MNQKVITILAIESSCDDTSVSIIQDEKILCNSIASQEIHKQYGGVVPELASRAHQQNIVPLIDTTLKNAGVNVKDLNAIAFTAGPGLIGSLMVGVSFAKAMALSLNIPLIAINHMQAHILAHFIDEPKPSFPFLCLTVSGGHTQLVLVHAHFTHEVIGKTIDDAAGEAFDKVAKILDLPYPGGPLVDKYAQNGNPNRFEFPIPNMDGLDYSFSGLKTSFLYFIQKQVKVDANFVANNLADICASIQHAIVKQLILKLIKAAKQVNCNQIAIAGGVSANSALRKALEAESKKRNWKIFIPKLEYCTDNAAMIAIAAHYKYLSGEFEEQSIAPYAR
ncbi:MAG: tRNA (adenosine(37)-N6)-threonylcarbamoyltransferase complex transferase subunit TsaD [Bacteroidia bacterium]|nr:tRNA (adenosine(37)-N6)-threonylcarbamoyltransferase complex transferase subunit TsaD [Bacteroidia bacterium]